MKMQRMVAGVLGAFALVFAGSALADQSCSAARYTESGTSSSTFAMYYHYDVPELADGDSVTLYAGIEQVNFTDHGPETYYTPPGNEITGIYPLTFTCRNGGIDGGAIWGWWTY